MFEFERRESTVFDKSMTPKLITQVVIDKFMRSPMIREIKTADAYYDGHNEAIEGKKRVYYDKDRKAIDNPNANNARIRSNFLRMLVQQKQDYGFAKPFVLKISDEKEKEIDLAENDYGKAWKDFCNEQLFKLSYTLAGQAVNHGMAWAYVWIDADGNLKIRDVPTDLIYPVWSDRQHTKLDRLVYNYTVERYTGSLTPTFDEFAEYFDENREIRFNVSDGYGEVPTIKDRAGNALQSHMTDGENPVSWGRIPFVWFKGTDDERTLLFFIKEQIDSYDVLASKSIDGLVDDLDPVLILKGISPEVGDLIEARELAKMTRTISLDTDGDANYIQAQTAIDAHLKELEALRRDIIKFGYGIDYEDSRFGGNPNQLVIKSLYQNMDTYTDGLERQFQNFIDNFKYFFDKWYDMSGRGSFDECQKYTVLVKLDRSMMVNQSAQIEDTVKLQGTGVSKKTLLEFNPVVQDVDLEMERIEEEQKQNADNDLFNFAQRTSIENGGEYEPSEEKEDGQEQNKSAGEDAE